METWLVVLLSALGVVLVVGLILGRQNRSARRFSTPHSPPPTAATLTAPQEAEIRGLLARDQMIPAIKRVLELTGCRLAEGRAIVDRLRATPGGPPTAPPPPPGSAPTIPPSDELIARLRQLERDGQAIWAIKTLGEETGMPLSDSKRFVDSLV